MYDTKHLLTTPLQRTHRGLCFAHSNLLCQKLKKKHPLTFNCFFPNKFLNMCKCVYEHKEIQQLRHKLNRFHRHLS